MDRYDGVTLGYYLVPSNHRIAMRMMKTATIIEMPSFMSEWKMSLLERGEAYDVARNF
jgi:hypothetical protein